jgi:hypothetical protein
LDPSEILGEAQDAYFANELETVLGTSSGEEDPEESETDGETEATSPATSGNAGGIDAAVKILEQTNPELAEAVRSQNAARTKAQQEAADLRRQVEGVEGRLGKAVEEAVAQAMAERDDDPEESEYSPEQIEAAKDKLRKMGVVFAEDVEQEKQLSSWQEMLKSSDSKAVESFGEMFGEVVDGEIQVNEEALSAMSQEMARLKSQGNRVTRQDLFILAKHEDLMKQAEERGYERGKKEKAERVDALGRAATENGSAGIDPAVNLRGKPGTRSDSISEVLRRANAVALKKVGLGR